MPGHLAEMRKVPDRAGVGRLRVADISALKCGDHIARRSVEHQNFRRPSVALRPGDRRRRQRRRQGDGRDQERRPAFRY